MTQQDLYNFGDALRVNRLSHSQFPAQERSLVEVMLPPNPNFTPWQTGQLRRWKLLAPDQRSIAASGRPHRASARMASNGDLLLESDLLSDRDGNYFLIKTFLESLTLVSRSESDFPQLEGEE